MQRYQINFLSTTFFPQVFAKKIVQKLTANGTHYTNTSRKILQNNSQWISMFNPLNTIFQRVNTENCEDKSLRLYRIDSESQIIGYEAVKTRHKPDFWDELGIPNPWAEWKYFSQVN